MSEWHQTFIRVLKRASRPDGRCTVKCMLLHKGAVNYCGCISRIEGAYIRIVGASALTKRYKMTPLPTFREGRGEIRAPLGGIRLNAISSKPINLTKNFSRFPRINFTLY